MKNISIIGTLHKGFTPKHELEEVLASINPDKVFAELSQGELSSPREKSIRDEMFAAYDWAVENGKLVTVFDIEGEDIVRPGFKENEIDFSELEARIMGLLKNYTWKELNKAEPWDNPDIKNLEEELTNKYFDTQKLKERDMKMLENVKEGLIDGMNVVVTGIGHLTFFKEQLPGAVLLFRN